jgi:hypothetical protein
MTFLNGNRRSVFVGITLPGSAILYAVAVYTLLHRPLQESIDVYETFRHHPVEKSLPKGHILKEIHQLNASVSSMIRRTENFASFLADSAVRIKKGAHHDVFVEDEGAGCFRGPSQELDAHTHSTDIPEGRFENCPLPKINGRRSGRASRSQPSMQDSLLNTVGRRTEACTSLTSNVHCPVKRFPLWGTADVIATPAAQVRRRSPPADVKTQSSTIDGLDSMPTTPGSDW